nr:glycosyltransferase [Sporolactobacillus sp. STSJ-5]
MLIISPYAPYDKVSHAGGQIHNFYLKKFNNDHNFDVRLITFAESIEVPKLDLQHYKVNCNLTVKSNKIIHRITRIPDRIMRTVNIFDRYGGIVSSFFRNNVIRILKKIKNEDYHPDVIILVWTPTALLVNEVKRFYPNAKYVAFEHDVFFQNLKRKCLVESDPLKKKMKHKKYSNELHTELNALKSVDQVITLNYKDKELLVAKGINNQNIDVVAPYFHFMKDKFPTIRSTENDIVFYGAMSRPENYESCIWFIENVFNKLVKKDPLLRFVIVGSHPNDSLLRYKSEKVIITGFVDHPEKYLLNSLCMVAPLFVGAGIKIKILEAMSAGIVVLTNKIGIEGIPASDGVHYLHCETDSEYIQAIVQLKKKKSIHQDIGDSAKKLIAENYNVEESYKHYSELILKLMD